MALLHVMTKQGKHAHPPGFRDVTLAMLKHDTKQMIPDKEQDIIIYSEEQQQTEYVVHYLEKLGYKNVVDLEPSMTEWWLKSA